MKKDLFLSIAVSGVWLVICFLCFGALYEGLPKIIGTSGFLRFDAALGNLDGLGISPIPWTGILLFGAVMIIASIPINYYWVQRLRQAQ